MAGPSPVENAQRVVVITGATSGIGREIALGVARQGFSTVVVGRREGRAAQAATEIAAATGNSHVGSLRVDDLAVVGQARSLVEGLLAQYPRIDVLVNNAGAYFHRREVTADGFERTFALNVLAPYVLSTLLASRLGASAPARIVNVSSAAHRGARVNLDDLQSSGRYSGFGVYGATKLELIWLTREYARRLAGQGVAVNAVHPGFVRSGFALNNGGGIAFGMRIASVFGRSVRRGADTPIYLATSADVANVSGKYFSDRKVRTGSTESADMGRARQLVEACARLSGVPAIPG